MEKFNYKKMILLALIVFLPTSVMLFSTMQEKERLIQEQKEELSEYKNKLLMVCKTRGIEVVEAFIKDKESFQKYTEKYETSIVESVTKKLQVVEKEVLKECKDNPSL